MYGKEASKRKQEIDRQHRTIPNKRTKDQKTSIMEMSIASYTHFHECRLWRYSNLSILYNI